MKRSTRFFSGFCMLLLLGTTFAMAQLSGTKTIGAGGDYATFADAITALNSNGVTSPGVEFRIADGTYTEASPLSIDFSVNLPSASAPVLFKPQPGAVVVLNVGGQLSPSRYALKIGSAANSVDYVTLDGSNVDGGATRDWTLKATATTYGIETIDIYGDYVTVKNCIVDVNSSGYSGSGYGISFRDAAPTATYGTVQNCKVTANNGISIGRSTTVDMPGFVVLNNEVHSLNRGIYLYYSSSATIQGNEIIGDAYNSYPSGVCYGIYTASPSGNTGLISILNNTVHNLGRNDGTAAAQAVRGIAPSGPGTYIISGNKVYNLLNATTSTGSPAVYGIQLSGGVPTSSYAVYNNFVSGLLDDDPVANYYACTYGIQYTTKGNAKIYHNTVFIDETTRDHICAAFLVSGGDTSTSVKIKNNIAVNLNASANYNSFLIYKYPTLLGGFESDYNIFYTSGAPRTYIGFWSVPAVYFDDWQLYSSQDLHSVVKLPVFKDSIDLHLAGGSLGDTQLAGIPLAEVTVDIDGETRSQSMPYIGADENLDIALPIQLAFFRAVMIEGSRVNVTWQTLSEIDNYGFEVERSADGKTFAALDGSFRAGHRTTNAVSDYSFSDTCVQSGIWYYRLMQIDLHGAVRFSDPVRVEVVTSLKTGESAPATYALAQNFPNPFNPATTIRFSVSQRVHASLTVFNALGQQVAQLVNGEVEAGAHEVKFNASKLSSGVYFYRLIAGTYSETRRLMLVR